MKTLFIACLCIMQLHSIAQTQSPDKPIRKSKHPIRNGVWVLPSGAEHINGLAVGVATMNIYKRPLQVKGINIDICPLGLVIGGFFIVAQPVATIMPNLFLKKRHDDFYKIDTSYLSDYPQRKITGLQLQAFGGIESNVYGIAVSGVISTFVKQRGLAVSFVSNISDDFKGIQISLWGNTSVIGQGVQIGLFNKCTDCKGLQIGLLNRNGRSLQPIINWRRKHQPEYFVRDSLLKAH